ncbi:hypothetical protein [Streptomyces sp. NPDC019507]
MAASASESMRNVVIGDHSCADEFGRGPDLILDSLESRPAQR